MGEPVDMRKLLGRVMEIDGHSVLITAIDAAGRMKGECLHGCVGNHERPKEQIDADIS